MILEIGEYGLNFEEDLEFLGNYQKSKSKPKDIHDIRFLFKGIKTGKEQLLCVGQTHPIMGNRIDFIMVFHATDNTYKQLKNGKYNYYFMNDEPNYLNEALEKWKSSNPLVSIGNYLHQKLNLIPNYTWAYKFNGKEY